MSGRRVAGDISSLVNGRGLHELLLKPFLMYDIKTMIWKEVERSRIKAVHMDKIKLW